MLYVMVNLYLKSIFYFQKMYKTAADVKFFRNKKEDKTCTFIA